MKQVAPDGYTVFLANNGLFAIMPGMTDVRFDPVKDFQPITPLCRFQACWSVPTASPARSVKDLVDPGAVKAGRTELRLAGRWLRRPYPGRDAAARIRRCRFTHVPYRGAGPAVTDLAAGNVDMLFSSYMSAIGQVQAGKLRVLGWTAPKRSPTLPDVPTMAEAGYPGIEIGRCGTASSRRSEHRRTREEAERGVHQGRAVPRHGAERLPRRPSR